MYVCVLSGYLPCCLSPSFEKKLLEVLFGFEEQLSQRNHTDVSMCWSDALKTTCFLFVGHEVANLH